jgi:hypothetical protein
VKSPLATARGTVSLCLCGFFLSPFPQEEVWY